VTIFKFGGTVFVSEEEIWKGSTGLVTCFLFYSTGHNYVNIQKVCSADHTVHSHVPSHYVLYGP